MYVVGAVGGVAVLLFGVLVESLYSVCLEAGRRWTEPEVLGWLVPAVTVFFWVLPALTLVGRQKLGSESEYDDLAGNLRSTAPYHAFRGLLAWALICCYVRGRQAAASVLAWAAAVC